MNAEPEFQPDRSTVAGLFALETHLRRGLPIPRLLRQRLAVPSRQLAATLGILTPRDRLALKLAIAHWAEEGLLVGPPGATELLNFIDSLSA